METTLKVKASELKLCMAEGWRMRNDRQRVVLYKYSTEEAEWRIIPPHVGVMLSLFDGERTVQDVAQSVESLFGMTPKDARAYLTQLLAAFHAKEPVLVDSSSVTDGDWCVYDPAEMIIAENAFQPNKRLEAPLSLLLMPFNTCDVSCRYCYAERKPLQNILPIERWREILTEAADAGVSMVTFSGGDPMRYPKIMPLLDILVERDFLFLMSTKSLITDKMARELAELGLGKRLFQISIDAWTPEMADHMVQRPGYRERALESIKNLLRHSIKVRTNTVCTPENYREAPTLLRKLHELGVTKSTVTTYGRSLFRHDDALFVSAGQMDWLRDEINQLKSELPDADVSFNGSIIDHNATPLAEKEQAWLGRANCSGGMTSMTICADGRVILCEQMPHDDIYTAGNLAEQDFLEVWNSPRMLEIAYPSRNLFKDSVCYDCTTFDECHKDKGYCFRDALNSYGSIYQPPPNCPKAPSSPRLG